MMQDLLVAIGRILINLALSPLLLLAVALERLVPGLAGPGALDASNPPCSRVR